MLQINEIYQLFRKAFGTHCGTVLFLASIRAYGCRFFNEHDLSQDKPIGIIYENIEEFQFFFRCLRCSPSESLLSLDITPRELEQLLSNTHDRFACFSYKRSRSATYALDRILDRIENMVQLSSLIMVGFQSCIPEEYADRFILLQLNLSTDALNNRSLFAEWNSTLIQYMAENTDAISGILSSYSNSPKRYERNAWLGSSIQLASLMNHEVYSQAPFAALIQNDLTNALNSGDGYFDTYGIPETIIHYLQEHAKTSTVKMYETNNIPISKPEELYSYPLCDGTYYYYSDRLFKEICEPLSNSLSFNQINYALEQGGYQKSELHGNRVNFTPKITLWTPYGAPIRPRFHMLVRTLVDAGMDSINLKDLYDNHEKEREKRLPDNETEEKGDLLYEKSSHLIR